MKLFAMQWLGAVLLLFLCSAFATQDRGPGEIEKLYQQGLDAYSSPVPDYAAASASWTAALELTPGANAAERARLCKSLGNVAFRQERPLEAAAWFSAAIRLTPRDSDAWANLELARTKAGLEPADRGDLAATFDRVVHSLSLAEAEWLALCAALGIASLIVLRALVFGRAATRWLALSTALGALAVVPWCVQLLESGRDPMFVISTAGVAVQSEPRAAATKVALLSAGARADRLEELAGWVRVATEHGERGWVPAETLLALRR
ncbi:MAG TPA: SH3 domain-containing protein [Planctomycetota bacterium]|nr:SH3 domain-containing protein [Planctomycetota bacterium]